jgi:UDP-N-acetyl-D-glucosamine dehydrogenase
MKNIVVDKLRSKNAVIGIIGLGYVGLPLAIRYSEEKFKVILITLK